MTDTITACTHDGTFHADDVFATALLKMMYGDSLKVIRTRDAAVIDQADIVYDVGGVFHPDTLRFDHHMADFPKRADQTPYSSVGLIWAEFGGSILRKKFPSFTPYGEVESIAAEIDREVILPIDKIDNGITPPQPTDITVAIDLFNPNWNDADGDEGLEAAFNKAVDFAFGYLDRLFEAKYAEYVAQIHIKEAAMAAEDPRLIELSQSVPFRAAIPRLGLNELLYVVSPSGSAGNWGVTAVSVSPDSFENRKDMPAAWAGLTGAALQNATGVKDAIFAHRSRFFAVAGSKEGALALAEIALNAHQ